MFYNQVWNFKAFYVTMVANNAFRCINSRCIFHDLRIIKSACLIHMSQPETLKLGTFWFTLLKTKMRITTMLMSKSWNQDAANTGRAQIDFT